MEEFRESSVNAICVFDGKERNAAKADEVRPALSSFPSLDDPCSCFLLRRGMLGVNRSSGEDTSVESIPFAPT